MGWLQPALSKKKQTKMKITKSQLKQIIKEELEKVVDEGRYSYDWNIPGNPSPMDDYDMQQRYARAKPKKSKKSSDEPSPEEQEENWREWQDLHPYEQISPSQKQSIMKHGKQGWPAV